jgi:sn-glycerol 3-phosphate transport system permease protein
MATWAKACPCGPTRWALAILAMMPPVLVVLAMQRLFVKGLVESEK